MKALTLTQPWATLVAVGAKHIETRSWSTRYRGPLAIHAAKGFPETAQRICLSEPFRTILKNKTDIKIIWDKVYKISDFPLGMIIVVCELVECYEIPAERKRFPIREMEYFNSGVWLPPNEPELSFGDYTPDRYAWILTNIRALDVPIPAKGALGLWEWTKEDW